MNVAEIAIRVKRQFGDESGVQIDDTDVLRWVNDAQHEISLQNQLFQTLATADLVAGQASYTLPTDILTMSKVTVKGEYVKFLNQNEAADFIHGPGATTTGTPTNSYYWANKLYLYPVPDTSVTAGIQMYYTRQPVAVAVTTDVPELPLQYHSRIVEYCLQQAYELDENWSAANIKGSQFAAGVMQLKDNVDWVERDVYPSITSTDYY